MTGRGRESDMEIKNGITRRGMIALAATALASVPTMAFADETDGDVVVGGYGYEDVMVDAPLYGTDMSNVKIADESADDEDDGKVAFPAKVDAEEFVEGSTPLILRLEGCCSKTEGIVTYVDVEPGGSEIRVVPGKYHVECVMPIAPGAVTFEDVETFDAVFSEDGYVAHVMRVASETGESTDEAFVEFIGDYALPFEADYGDRPVWFGTDGAYFRLGDVIEDEQAAYDNLGKIAGVLCDADADFSAGLTGSRGNEVLNLAYENVGIVDDETAKRIAGDAAGDYNEHVDGGYVDNVNMVAYGNDAVDKKESLASYSDDALIAELERRGIIADGSSYFVDDSDSVYSDDLSVEWYVYGDGKGIQLIGTDIPEDVLMPVPVYHGEDYMRLMHSR